MKAKIVIINGPNLNLLGLREPEIYGDQSFDEYLGILKEKFPNISIEYKQSNHEGVLIDWLQEFGFSAKGIVINPAGYSHTSIAIRDCIKAIETPVVEVHISNIYEREAFRHHSYIKDVCAKSIVGEGLKGYDQAIEYLLNDI